MDVLQGGCATTAYRSNTRQSFGDYEASKKGESCVKHAKEGMASITAGSRGDLAVSTFVFGSWRSCINLIMHPLGFCTYDHACFGFLVGVQSWHVSDGLHFQDAGKGTL